MVAKMMPAIGGGNNSNCVVVSVALSATVTTVTAATEGSVIEHGHLSS